MSLVFIMSDVEIYFCSAAWVLHECFGSQKPESIVLTSDCGQVHIVISSCISILYLECWYVFVSVFYYCYKVVSSCLGICWLYCVLGQCFNLRFRNLILWSIDISLRCLLWSKEKVLLYIFIYVVKHLCYCYRVCKELGNDDPASASCLP